MSHMKLGSLMIALGAVLLVAPSVAHASIYGLPHCAQVGVSIQPGETQLTDPVRPIYLASLLGRQGSVSVKPPARSRFTSIFDYLFGRRGNVSRAKGTVTIVRKQRLESKGPKLDETLAAQPAVTADEKAASFVTPAATPAAAPASAQSPPIAPIPTPNPGPSRINDLPALPLE